MASTKRPPPRFEPLDPPQLNPKPVAKPVARRPVPAPPPAAAVPVAPTPAPAPIQSAAAITYRSDSGAPRIVAKGRGMVAEQIIARAREHGVAVHQSKELVALLMQVELDAQIPPALYRAVAELLAWLYQIEAATRPAKVSLAPPRKRPLAR
jgi:flagellar biosynthesis protein